MGCRQERKGRFRRYAGGGFVFCVVAKQPNCDFLELVRMAAPNSAVYGRPFQN